MRYLTSLSLAAVAIATLATARSIPKRDDRNRAAYTLLNDPAGASIVSLKIAEDGTLSNPVKTPTGGKGSSQLPLGQVDQLASQNSVIVSESYLFNVNAGSNTVSMFFIDKEDPWHPKLVGKPANTLGEFPVSVAYSAKLKTVCVLNGGAISGVTCFSADHEKGLTLLDKAIRPVDLRQTTPPTQSQASDIFFNPSSTALFVTFKGTLSPPRLGATFAWAVVDGKVSESAVVNTINDIPVPFGASFAGSDSKLFITDPTFGVALVDVSSSLNITEKVHTSIPGQQGDCWSVYAERFNSVYVIDAGRTTIAAIDAGTGAVKSTFNFDSAQISATDGAIDRTHLYVLSSAGSVVAIDLEGSNSGKVPKQVQALNLTGLGTALIFEGLATYPS
ncbi:MAG: hypothetical protein M1829_002681 [Trizodia sp. TS-e1964]|nr:MAG: hypothetical protein M1829_002681 [Trizodia sp. TS-e1964]